MELSVDLERVSRQTYRMIRRDGLGDIGTALMLALFALFFFDFKYSYMLIFGCAIQTVILPLARRKITYPRVGYVKHAEPDRGVGGILLFNILLPLLVIVVLIVAGLVFSPVFPLLLGIFLAFLTSQVAVRTGYFLDYAEITVFSLGGLIAFVMVQKGNNEWLVTAYMLWVFSFLLVIPGIIQLITFWNKYYRSGREASHDTP